MSSVCSVCLAGNRSLNHLKDNLLHLYEKFYNVKINSKDAKQRALCCYCHQKLLRCYTFSQMVHRSEMILSQLLSEGIEITHDYITEHNLVMKQHLSVSTMTTFEIVNTNQVNIKKEQISVKVEMVKEEDDVFVSPEDCTNSHSTVKEDSDQGIYTEELSPNTHVEQTKPENFKITFTCNYCNQEFFHKTTLISHIRKSHSPLKNLYSGTVCDKQFINNSEVVRHQTSHTEYKSFACHVCKKQFNKNNILVIHMRTHKGKKSFACDACGKQYKDKRNLVVHMRKHSGEKPFECNVCGEQYRDKRYLVVHMRNHTSEKPFRCNVCNKHFSFKNTFVAHIRTHTGDEKPFGCHVCDKRFGYKSTLVTHMNTHTSEKPFTCPVCDQKFISKVKLVNHSRTHTSEKPFDCNECGKKFKGKRSLRNHMRKHTGEDVCDVCGKLFSYRSALNRHKLIHTGEKPYACHECDKKFNQRKILTYHIMRIHTGEKPVACNLCDKRFIDKSTLGVHMRSHTVQKLLSANESGNGFKETHS